MKKSLFLSSLIGMLAIAPVAKAENLAHLSQLLSTRRCINCSLISTGLVNAKLGGADMTGSDLRQANLSGANLSMANLSGADLRGASLAGANLASADLTDANLDGADLRGAYLAGANFSGTSLNTYYISRAVGLMDSTTSPEQLYQWGFIESESNNLRMAIAYYNQAAKFAPDNGAIYLSRAIANLKLKDYNRAQQDVALARNLFVASGSTVGVEASDRLTAQIELALNPDNGSGNSFGNVVGSITTMLLRLFF